MFKNMRFGIIFHMFLNPSFKMTTSFRIIFYMLLNPTFKMTTSFANIARTTATTCKSIYNRKDFKVSGIGSL